MSKKVSRKYLRDVIIHVTRTKLHRSAAVNEVSKSISAFIRLGTGACAEPRRAAARAERVLLAQGG